jgi:hypothetical protein
MFCIFFPPELITIDLLFIGNTRREGATSAL